MESVRLLDCAGRHRSPATTSSFDQGLPPRNKGMHYPPDLPTIEESGPSQDHDDSAQSNALTAAGRP